MDKCTKGEEILRTFYEKNGKHRKQAELRAKKVMKEKGDELWVKWKGHDNLINSLINKKWYHYIKMSYYSEPGSSRNKIKV